MKPILKIGTNDYTEFLEAEGLKPTRNDLDADGSGRNLLDGLMYRSRIAQKLKWTVSFNRIDEDTMARLENDMSTQYVSVTLLNPKTKAYDTRTYYCSTINNGVQRWDGHKTVYDGVTFNLTER